MVQFIELSTHSGYIGQDERFLCPKIGVVHGSGGTFFFDCGTSKRQLDLIDELRGKGVLRNPSYLGISHFHADHIANFPYFASCETYGSSTTARYVRVDKAVGEKTVIDLGDVQVTLMPLISSHSKGSMIAISSDGVCFVGDALYDGNAGYNRSALYETIKTIEGVDAFSFVYGHEPMSGERKEDVTAFLKSELEKLK
ncbi:MAG: MBL fold metallo-hydrolase [Bacilli bacterium]|nr:MBL fold metallo-hydrolase [Bacilli bacterium]